MPDTRSASCNCGAIRIEARGEPIRAGICHCTTCRKESGGPFMAFAVWHADHVKIEGRTASWKATRDDRHFCPFCGSTLFGVEEGTKEIEVRLGAFDAAPTDLVPTYGYGSGDGSGGFRCCRAGSSLRAIGRRWGRGIRAGAEPQNHRFVPSTIACNPNRTEKLAIGLIAAATHGNPTRTAPAGGEMSMTTLTTPLNTPRICADPAPNVNGGPSAPGEIPPN